MGKNPYARIQLQNRKSPVGASAIESDFASDGYVIRTSGMSSALTPDMTVTAAQTSARDARNRDSNSR